MKNKIFVLLLLIFSFIQFSVGAETFSNPEIGFSVEAPDKWYVTSNNDFLENNLTKLSSKQENIDSLLKTHQGSLLVVSFYRDNPKLSSGIIPTINILLRSNPAEDFDAFAEMMNKSADSIGGLLKNYKLKEKPQIIELDGKKAIFFECNFTLTAANEEDYEIYSRTYALPVGKHFFQINFSDEVKNQNRELFEKTLKSIKVYPGSLSGE